MPWNCQTTVATPLLAWATVLIFLTNPWCLPLPFVVSGSAIGALLLKGDDTEAFPHLRMARLGIPLLFGMAVIVFPQP